LINQLKPVIGKQADTLWNLYLAEDYQGRRDLAQEIEIVAERILKQGVVTNKILLPPPNETDSQGSLLIGNALYNDKTLHGLYLREEDLTKQVGLFAVTGEGKTNAAYLLALQLLKKRIPFMVIDWKRSWRNLLSLKDVHPELKDVQVFTIGRDVLPLFWNPFRPPPGSEKQFWVGTICEALEKSHLSGPGVAYLLNMIFLKSMKGLAGDDCYPNCYDGLKELDKMRVYQREMQWKQSAVRILSSLTVGAASKVFNTRNPVKLEELLDRPVILELDLEMPKPLRVFFSEMILRWIHLYRLSQGETQRLRHCLFLEEAHNLFSTPSYHKDTASLESIYREIRAFGQGMVSITQHPSLLPIYLLGNCHTQIFLGLQHEDDVKTARKSLFLGYDQEPYLNILKVGEALVKVKNRIDPCHVRIPLVPVKRGAATDEWLKANTPVNTHIGGRGYLSRRPDGGKGGGEGYLPVDYSGGNSKGKEGHLKVAPHYRLLVDILEYPFSAITKRYERLGFNPKTGNQFKNQLIVEDCIRPEKIVTTKGWITLFGLKQKANLILQDLGYEVSNTNEGIVHKYWKHQIAGYYRAKGLEVAVEEKINGRADIIVKDGGRTIAVEIETGMSDAIGNIERASKAGVDEIVSVATTRAVEEKIRGQLKHVNIADDRVRVTSVFSFGRS